MDRRDFIVPVLGAALAVGLGIKEARAMVGPERFVKSIMHWSRPVGKDSCSQVCNFTDISNVKTIMFACGGSFKFVDAPNIKLNNGTSHYFTPASNPRHDYEACIMWEDFQGVWHDYYGTHEHELEFPIVEVHDIKFVN